MVSGAVVEKALAPVIKPVPAPPQPETPGGRSSNTMTSMCQLRAVPLTRLTASHQATHPFHGRRSSFSRGEPASSFRDERKRIAPQGCGGEAITPAKGRQRSQLNSSFTGKRNRQPCCHRPSAASNCPV